MRRMSLVLSRVVIASPLVFAGCSTPPPPNSRFGRTPSSAVETQKPAIKKIGDRVQVIQTAVRPPTPEGKAGVVMLDVMCPREANQISNGGCTIADGIGLHRVGNLTGFYPLVSAEGGEGYRCLFDDAGSKDELTAMAFCKAPPPKIVLRRRPVPAEGGLKAPESAVPGPAAPADEAAKAE